MKLLKGEAVQRLKGYFGDNQVLNDFANPILQWYQEYLTLEERADILNSSAGFYSSEQKTNMYLKEVMFLLKISERTTESVVHELLHMELRMKRIPIEIGIEEKDSVKEGLMGLLVNYLEHCMFIEKYLALGLQKEKFVSPFISPDINIAGERNKYGLNI